MKIRVLVRLKPGILDVQGAAVKRRSAASAFRRSRDLRVGKVIEIELDDATAGDARPACDEMCRQLLANPILEDFTIETVSEPCPAPGRSHA